MARSPFACRFDCGHKKTVQTGDVGTESEQATRLEYPRWKKHFSGCNQLFNLQQKRILQLTRQRRFADIAECKGLIVQEKCKERVWGEGKAVSGIRHM